MAADLKNLFVVPTICIREAMSQMGISRIGLVLVVDDQRRLLGTVTDGDVRRAILDNVGLGDAVEVLLARKSQSNLAKPVTAPANSSRDAQLAMFQQLPISHLPLVDKDQRVVDLVTIRDFVPDDTIPPQAVIMAGGMGTRLRPLTDELPKPMLPVGDRPLLELIIDQLKQAGISRVNLTTHYKKEAIIEHFGDGDDFGVDIRYVEEDQPLGTAGALSLLSGPVDEPLLVINGDILTRVDFRAMHKFHQDHEADMTIAVRQYEIQIPYGVIENEGANVTGITEKPQVYHLINAGIYLLEPTVIQFIPKEQPYDMPELITRLIAEGRRVVSFPIPEFWLDIGQFADYQAAQVEAGKEGFI
jgi:dTDP-glucose pyrophosphorylase